MKRSVLTYRVPLLVGIALAAAACGSSSSSAPAAGSAVAAASSAAPSAATSGPPGSALSTGSVPGLGTVVVDGAGKTVYVLTADGSHNLPCTDASGCTKVWPDLSIPAGSTPTAGQGLQPQLLTATKGSDGETYPTYKGWFVYEFQGDSAAGQGNGQGIKSFGGTWYALTAAGTPVTTTVPASAAPSSASTGGYYGY